MRKKTGRKDRKERENHKVKKKAGMLGNIKDNFKKRI